MRSVLASLMIVALLSQAGCSRPSVEATRASSVALKGLPVSELLTCAGVPDRSRREGTTEWLTYESSELRTDSYGFSRPSIGVYGGSGGFGAGVGVGIGGYYDTDVFQTYCEATFRAADGVVEEVIFRSTGGQGRYDQCWRIVQGCMNRAPAVPPDQGG